MQFFLAIAAALLITAYSAPTTELPTNSPDEEVTTVTEEYTGEFWISEVHKNVTKVELPDADKKILCDFLGTFGILKMELFNLIFVVNMEYMKNVENKFEFDFKEYQDKHPDNNNKTQLLQEFIGIKPFKIYLQDSIYKQKFYQDIGKAYQTTNEHFIKEAQKIKGKLSQKTVESEKEFFEKFKTIEVPSKKYYNDKIDVINQIEEEYKYRYQCKEEE